MSNQKEIQQQKLEEINKDIEMVMILINDMEPGKMTIHEKYYMSLIDLQTTIIKNHNRLTREY